MAQDKDKKKDAAAPDTPQGGQGDDTQGDEQGDTPNPPGGAGSNLPPGATHDPQDEGGGR